MGAMGRWLASLLLVCSCATTPEASEPPTPPGRFVEVQPGQTVWELAQESGLTVDEIVEVNGLENAAELAAGQVLFLPASALAPRPKPPAPAAALPTPRELPRPPAGDGLLWPTDGVVLRAFGSGKPPYDGVLIAAPSGTPVVAVASGGVAFAGDQGTTLGAFVIIDHGNDLLTITGHLSSVDVKAGDVVSRGQRIGAVGTSGLVGVSPRVHFQLRKNKAPVDPVPELAP